MTAKPVTISTGAGNVSSAGSGTVVVNTTNTSSTGTVTVNTTNTSSTGTCTGWGGDADQLVQAFGGFGQDSSGGCGDSPRGRDDDWNNQFWSRDYGGDRSGDRSCS